MAHKTEQEIEDRLNQIQKEIQISGTYRHAADERAYGADFGWFEGLHVIVPEGGLIFAKTVLLFIVMRSLINKKAER